MSTGPCIFNFLNLAFSMLLSSMLNPVLNIVQVWGNNSAPALFPYGSPLRAVAVHFAGRSLTSLRR